MAAILILVFVFGLCSWISSGKDKAKRKAYSASFQDDNNIRLFFCNLYAVTWQYYQQIEPQVIKDLAEFKPRFGYDLTIEDLEKYSQAIYGQSAWERAIEKAFLEMKKNGCPVYKLNPDPSMRYQFGQKFIPLGKGESYEIRDDLEYYKMEMKHPGSYYDWESAKNVSYLFPMRCIPEETDPRTYYYMTYGTQDEPQIHKWFRRGTPREIAEAVSDMEHPGLYG